MYPGAQDAHLYKEHALGIGLGAYGSLYVHTQNLDGIAQGQILGAERGCFFGRCLKRHLFACGIHFFTQFGASLFQFFCGEGFLSGFIEDFHRLVSVFLGFPKNTVCLLIGLRQDALFPLFQFILFFL